MAKALRVTGERELMRNLNKEIQLIKGDIGKGMLAATLFVKGEAMGLTPIDFGLLRNSAFNGVAKALGGKIVGIVGYTAKYAPWVHEMPMTLKGQPRADFGETREGVKFGGGSGKGVYWQGGENKFLEKAVIRNIPTILNIIVKRAKR